MFTSLLIIYFVSFTVLSYRKIDWAIYAIILALPTYLIRFQVFGIPATLLEGMILVLFVVWLLKRFKISNLKFQIDKKLILPIVLFLLAATISIFIAPELQVAAGIWKAYFVEPILFFIVFISVIKDKKQIKNVLWALGLSILVPGVLAIIQKFTGVFIPNPFWQAIETRRVTSVYGFPNAIGLYFAPIMTLLAGNFIMKLKKILSFRLSRRQMEKSHNTSKNNEVSRPSFAKATEGRQARGDNKKLVVSSLLLVVGLFSIIFAASKGALLAIGIGLLFYALFWKGLRVWFVGLLILGVVGAFVFTPNLLSTQGTSTVTGGGSLEIRTEQWGEAWQMLKTRPIFGAGLSGYQAAVEPFHEKDYIEIFMYPHQIIFNFWTEIGLLGLLAFVWLIVIFFRKTFNNYGLRITDYSLPVAGAMVTLLSHGLVDVPYFKNDLSILFWILVALIVIQATNKEHLKYIENDI